MTRDLDTVGAMPFAHDCRGRAERRDPIEAALSSIEQTLTILRAAPDQPPLPPSDMKQVARLAEAPNDAAGKPRSGVATALPCLAVILAAIAGPWSLA
jgi:hypothetical protein